MEATKYQSNSIREWGGHRISHTGWLEDPWQLVGDGEFKKAEVIATFHTREDLWNCIKTNI
jgi:hypothetical protein